MDVSDVSDISEKSDQNTFDFIDKYSDKYGNKNIEDKYTDDYISPIPEEDDDNEIEAENIPLPPTRL